MADKKENTLNSGTPAQVRALDSAGNSINALISSLFPINLGVRKDVTDLNSMNFNGIAVYNNTTVANSPTPYGIVLQVSNFYEPKVESGNWIFQLAFCLGSDQLALRQSNNGAEWTTWKTVLFS